MKKKALKITSIVMYILSTLFVMCACNLYKEFVIDTEAFFIMLGLSLIGYTAAIIYWRSYQFSEEYENEYIDMT